METEKYHVEIRGTKPLLMNAPNAAELDSRSIRRRSEIPGEEEEIEKRLYKDPSGNICIPAYVIKGAIRAEGRNYRAKQRKSTYASLIRAGIDIEPEYIPLKYDELKVDKRVVSVRGSRIVRIRPRFDKWTLEL